MRSWGFILSSGAIILSAFHFWPFPNCRLWQLLTPSNSLVALWCGAVAVSAIVFRSTSTATRHLPPASVLSYLVVVCMSVAVAPDAVRASVFASKLALGYLCAYSLLRYVAAEGGAMLLCKASGAALALAVAFSFVARATGTLSDFGFFDDPHKYGSYVGVLSVLCGSIMLAGDYGWPTRMLGAATFAVAAASCASLGALAALGAGLAVCFALARGPRRKLASALVCLCAIVAVTAVLHTETGQSLGEDIELREQGRPDIRQRYLDWQAYMNVLSERAAAGSGAGCINTLRGMYYDGLPKLNTMGPFEQNLSLIHISEPTRPY